MGNIFFLDVFHFGSDSEDFEVDMPSFSSTPSQPLTNFSTFGSSDCFGMSGIGFQGWYWLYINGLLMFCSFYCWFVNGCV